MGASILASAGQQDDWPSYNRTLTSQRFARRDEITRENVKQLKVVCTYDPEPAPAHG